MILFFKKFYHKYFYGKSLKFIIGRILVRTGLCQMFSIKKELYKLRFYPSSLSLALWENPLDRNNDEIFFNHYLKQSDNVIDAGSNIGTLTLTASTLAGNSGQVFSIEANPTTFKYLKGNIEFNKKRNVTLYNLALGDVDGEIMFTDNSNSSDDQNKVVINGRGIKIPVKRLDDLDLKVEKIHLLKVDVEGFELFVLKGGERLLKRTDCVYFESWEKHFRNYNYSTKDVLGLLKNDGFKCYRFKDSFSLEEVNRDYLSEYCENIIAIKDIVAFNERTNSAYSIVKINI